MSAGFEILGSRELARAGFLGLDELDVRSPDGEQFTRVVVHHPGAVAVVPIVDDSVVLVRQYRAAIGRVVLEIPAGKRDVDGEPPTETARRELEEEIGYRPGRLLALAEFYNSPGFTDEYTYLYAAFDLEDLGQRGAVGPEEQAMTIERVPFASIDDLVARGELVDAKSIIGLSAARRLVDGGP